MSPPVRTDPPYVPIRHTRWATRRTPRWVLLAVADAYGVSGPGIPETFFLDARHRIVKRVLGGVTRQELTAGVALMKGTP